MATETRTVTVGSVAKKKGNTNNRDWVRYSLMDDDDKFVGSTFDKAIGDALDNYSGKRVEVDLDVKTGERGKLYDLVAVRLANGTPPAIPALQSFRDSTIVREVALKAAVSYYAGREATPTDVFALADKYVRWINEQADFDPDSAEIPF